VKVSWTNPLHFFWMFPTSRCPCVIVKVHGEHSGLLILKRAY
jgi:hypothetical protein